MHAPNNLAQAAESIKSWIFAAIASIAFLGCAQLPQPTSPKYAGEGKTFKLTGEMDTGKLPAGEGDYTHYLPVNIIAINSHRHFYRFSEAEVENIVAYSREVFDRCAIEVRAKVVQSYEAPREFNTLDQGTEENVWGISAKEERLLGAFHMENEITVYAIRNINSANGINSSYSIRDGTTLGYDKRYSGTVYLKYADFPLIAWYGKFVPAHEMGHILFNEDHPSNPDTRNIMSSGRGFSFDVTPNQCKKARNSRFVRKIQPPKKNRKVPKPKPQQRIKIPRRLSH
jgi:hypothetical protein